MTSFIRCGKTWTPAGWLSLLIGELPRVFLSKHFSLQLLFTFGNRRKFSGVFLMAVTERWRGGGRWGGKLSVTHKINPLTPNVNYGGRTAPLTSKVSFYIFIQQILVLNILNMVYTLRFFSSKCSLFHNSNVFGSVLFTFYIQVC